MPDNGLKFSRTQTVILTSVGVILGVAFIVVLLLIAAGKLPGCKEEPISPEGLTSQTAISKPGVQLPDIQIIQQNSWGIDPLATKFRFVSDTQVTVNCPLALFNGGAISSSDPRMAHFLEVKSMKIDSNGNELAFSELYKPGSSNEAGYYVFDPSCIPTLSCPSLAHDTLKVNQWDEYLVNYTVFGEGITVHEATPNAGANPFPEKPGTANDHYFFALKTWQDSLGWHTMRHDQALTNPVIAKLKKK